VELLSWGGKQNRKTMKRQKLFRTPYLYDNGGDLTKRWWIEYGYRDPRTSKMVRKRYCEGFTELSTRKARVDFATKVIADLTEKLLKGWIPDDDTTMVPYVDELEYHQAAKVYGRRREAVKNIRIYASDYITLMKNTKAKKTFESYRGKIREFIAWLEKNKIIDNHVATIDSKVLHQFFDHLINDRKLAGVTVEKYKLNIGGLFSYMLERGIIQEKPVLNITLPQVGEDFAAIPFLDDDMEKIVTVIRESDPQLYLAAMLQYFCFIRPGEELLSLKVKQINFQKRNIFIPKDVAKRRESRTMDVPTQLYEILIEHGINRLNKEMYVMGPTGRPGFHQLGLNTLRGRFNKFRDQLGLSVEYKWYSFKHTGAGKLLESGASIVEVMRQLGHSDIASTYHYIKRHFGERSEHVLNKFPSPPGIKRPKKVSVNWLEGVCNN
jgi:site-specific recombinase XerD